MPWYQRIFIAIRYVLVGVIALGVFLDALGNVKMIPLRLAIIFTLLILAVWISIQAIAHYRGIAWQTKGKQCIVIRRFTTSTHLMILGVVALLWAPQIIPGLGNPDDGSGSKVQERILSGIIWDESNEPVPGVDVSLPTYGITMTTDPSGRFQFRVKAPQETVTVIAQKAGYLAQRQDATLGNSELSMTLRKRP